MRQVSSSACCAAAAPTARRRRVRRAVAAAAVGLALLAGAAPTASAETDRLEARHAELQAQIEAAQAVVDQQRGALERAEAALQASQQQLAEARAELDRTRAELTAAKEADAELADRLAREQKLLRQAQAETARARAAVETQRQLIARAARDAFQQHADLASVQVVLGASSTGEVQQRLQWDTTIFDTTGARLTELQRLEKLLEEAEARQAAVEAEVAKAKAASAANVERIGRLEAQAAEQEADVATLVASNETYAAQAQAALEADQRDYDALIAEERQIEGEIAAIVASQLANGASREDIAKLVAMGVVWTDPATYPLANEGPQMILSPQGFIRPVKAKPGSPFGMRFHPILKYWRMHNGTDYGAACGEPLYAAQSGTVVKAGAQGGFGNYTIIDHGVVGGKSIMTGYGHQSSMVVRVGQRVEMGQLIGYVGTTGLSTGCHLHLQVYANGTPVNPLTYIP